MNDPHVVSLTYQMRVGSSIRFNDPPALEREYDAFRLRLDAGTLVATMKAHFATSDEARVVVDPVLRSWEIDASLTSGLDAISFTFDTAEIIDRSPPPPGTPMTYRNGTNGGTAFGGSAGDILTCPKYPDPPARFRASDEVQWMWYRYEQFKAGKEPLSSMAYFCLSLLEGTTGARDKARAAVCAMYRIDRAVRNKLGDLISEDGSPAEARKLDRTATRRPLIHTERRWVEEVVRALIRRKAEYDADPTAGAGLADTELGDRRVRLAADRQAEQGRLTEVDRRLTELTAHREQVQAELNRMRRVETANEVFKGLRVTRCPCCDQKVTPGSVPDGQCYVCRQTLPPPSEGGAKERVAFEVEQLEGENVELGDLLEKLRREREALVDRARHLDEEIAQVEVLLRPMRSAVAAVLPPEMSVLDTQVGQLEERLAQLQRLRRAVERRDELTKQIDDLNRKVQGLSSNVDAKSAGVPFERLSDVMSDGINDYLNILKGEDPDRWLHQPVRFDVNENSFKVRVGKSPFSSLGATSICYVLLGYHYALLKLSGQEGYNYPGLSLIDFPVTLADKTTIGDKENYLIVPFVRLAAARPHFQLVVCGRAFQSLAGVHRVELKQVWKQGETAPTNPGGPSEGEGGGEP